MNNDPWANRDDGGNAGAGFEGYGSLGNTSLNDAGEKNENISKTEQQMGMTAVKAAELKYAERAKKARENVEKEIQQAREAFAQRAQNMTPAEEVAARTEMASDFAKKAEELSQAAQSVGEANHEQKENAELLSEVQSLRETVADLTAQIEGLKYLIQQGQEAYDRKLNNYAETIAGMEGETASEPKSEERDFEPIPDGVADEMLANAGGDESHEGMNNADNDGHEGMNNADGTDSHEGMENAEKELKLIDISKLPEDIDKFYEEEYELEVGGDDEAGFELDESGDESIAELEVDEDGSNEDKKAAKRAEREARRAEREAKRAERKARYMK